MRKALAAFDHEFQRGLLVVAALAGWACSGSPTGPSSPCGVSTVRTVSLPDSVQLFTPGRMEDASSATHRFYVWSFAVDSACTRAIPGQDSIMFAVSTSGSIPDSFAVTGIASVGIGGGFEYAVPLDRASVIGGYVFSGTQKTFDIETEAGSPSTFIIGLVQVSFPAVGTTGQDSVLLQKIMQNMSLRFDYHGP